VLAGPEAGERQRQALDVDGRRDLARADVRRDVVAERVAQVVRQVRQRALARCLSLLRDAVGADVQQHCESTTSFRRRLV
jgi:hypothetical protein